MADDKDKSYEPPFRCGYMMLKAKTPLKSFPLTEMMNRLIAEEEMNGETDSSETTPSSTAYKLDATLFRKSDK